MHCRLCAVEWLKRRSWSECRNLCGSSSLLRRRTCIQLVRFAESDESDGTIASPRLSQFRNIRFIVGQTFTTPNLQCTKSRQPAFFAANHLTSANSFCSPALPMHRGFLQIIM